MARGPAGSSRGLKSVWHLEVWQETDTVTRQAGPLYPRPRKSSRAHSEQPVQEGQRSWRKEGALRATQQRLSPWAPDFRFLQGGPHTVPRNSPACKLCRHSATCNGAKGLDARTLGSTARGKVDRGARTSWGRSLVLGEEQGLRARGGVKLQTALGCGGVAGKCKVSLARGGVAGSCRKRGREPRRAICSHSLLVILGNGSAQHLHRGSHTRPLTSDLKPVPSPP